VIWLAALLGLLAGFAIAYRIGSLLVPKMVSATRDRTLAIWLALGGGVAMVLPAFFLSFVVGGTLGGALGERVSQSFGLGIAGVPFGLAAGIAVIFAFMLLAGALAGVGIARLIIRLRVRPAPEDPC